MSRKWLEKGEGDKIIPDTKNNMCKASEMRNRIYLSWNRKPVWFEERWWDDDMHASPRTHRA